MPLLRQITSKMLFELFLRDWPRQNQKLGHFRFSGIICK